MQDPAKDPKEPYGSESSSAGNDHGWSNCTAVSGALALAYQQPRGELAPQGGDIRHRQSDQSGGIDLYDVRQAWDAYGETLTIKSGAGWSAVVDTHDAGRAIIIQGTGNVPGAETFDGGHACCIAPETRSSDGYWLFGDPLATGWQWVKPSAIRSWAEAWQSSIAFAAGEKPPAEPAPAPPPEPDCPDCPPPPDPAPRIAYEVAYAVAADDDADVAEWIGWLRAGEPFEGDVWDQVAWQPVGATLALLDAGCGQLGAEWSRGPLPDPVASAYLALVAPAVWDGSGWRAALWLA
jgi:hypothetical protein